ncbi:MAG: alpha/beta hydrolase [Bacteroidota bacterium]
MKLKKRYLIPLVLIGGIALGPRPDFPAFDGQVQALSMSLGQLDAFIAEKEAAFDLKDDNHARIIWADSIRRTEYSVVYLHGFSASPMEGDPIHREFAARYGCNLYLARLTGHGIKGTESFMGLTPAALMESAKEALAIGNLLGEKVILMSCSTGSTLGNFLAAESPDKIYAQMLYSPNIDIADKASNLLTMPWGKQLAKTIIGDYNQFTVPPGAEQYWTTKYRVEGLLCLKNLLEETMTAETFKKIEQPLYVGYYYKDEEHHDDVVSVEAIKEFFEKVSTPADLKKIDTYPNVDSHVGINRFQSKDLDDVRQKTFRFAEEVLKLQPVLPPAPADEALSTAVESD